MAVATGTALAIGSAVAGTAGAALGARAQNRATDAQARATRDALSYEREKEWQARASARNQWEGYMRSVYGDRFQPNTPAAAPIAPAVVAPVAPAAAPVVPGPVAAVGALPSAELTEPPMVASRSVASVGPWSASNYVNYLGRR